MSARLIAFSASLGLWFFCYFDSPFQNGADAFSITAAFQKRIKLKSTKCSHEKKTFSTTTELKGWGDAFSGVTGILPNSLLSSRELEELVDGTSLGGTDKDLKCVYKATRDGWSAIDFHKCCDGRGSGLVVCLTKTGKKLGGFHPLGWMGTDDYGTSNSAFLWFSTGNNKITKCPVLPGGNAAVFDFATGGPQFGASDLIIGSPQAAVMGGFAGPDMQDTKKNAGNLRQGISVLGGAYQRTPGWLVGGKFSLAQVEVYCNANIQPRMAKSFLNF